MRNYIKLMTALALAAPFAPCRADDVVIIQAPAPAPISSVETVEVRSSTLPTTLPTTISTSSSSVEVIDAKKGVQFKFKERIADLQSKINTAVDKGWMTSAQASDFRAEGDRLMTAANSAESLGWPKADVDVLEKNVTKLNADVASASTASEGVVITK